MTDFSGQKFKFVETKFQTEMVGCPTKKEIERDSQRGFNLFNNKENKFFFYIF